jgi:hypothetical protein
MNAAKRKAPWKTQAVMICGLLNLAACGDPGISADISGMGSSIIGKFLVRNAGTDFSGPPEEAHERFGTGMDRPVVQRLLELARIGRQGDPDTFVNEAIALNENMKCPNYIQLPVRLEGCKQVKTPEYAWRSTKELAIAAAAIGLTCNEVTLSKLSCEYRGHLTEHFVRYVISPSIDGARDGPDYKFEEVARLTLAVGNPIAFSVTETRHQSK